MVEARLARLSWGTGCGTKSRSGGLGSVSGEEGQTDSSD